MWTDSHCHLGFEGESDDAVDDAVSDAASAGVTRMVTIGTDAATSERAVAAARRHEHVYATVGLHPHEASVGVATITSMLESPDPKVVGVGECGLDYYYEHSPRPAQKDAFEAQIALAGQADLALVVHTRDAWEDTFAIIDGAGAPARWIVHCFSGGPEQARQALDRGAYLSFSGIVTFKKATEVQAAAALCPLDRILVETDSPYLAPVPNRGRTNRPAWASLVGAAVAELKGVPAGDLARATWDNTTAAFRLPA